MHETEVKKCMPLSTAKVVESAAEVLRETDCNGVIVRRKFANEKYFAGSKGM